jgi:predicted MPP superfamily phosphohydrolase
VRTVYYSLKSNRVKNSVCIALASDLHDRKGEDALTVIAKRKPDLIAIPGDLTHRLDLPEGAKDSFGRGITHKNAVSFLRRCAQIAPTFYSLGNHEVASGKTEIADLRGRAMAENISAIAKTGAVLLCDRSISMPSFAVGGMTSGCLFPNQTPSLKVLDELERAEGLRILLCHHPEYYPNCLKQREVDLILAGHAHGGQIRFFGRGLYAPGQGILPKYAGGAYDGKLIVGRGLCNTVAIPRLFNEPELVLIEVLPISK